MEADEVLAAHGIDAMAGAGAGADGAAALDEVIRALRAGLARLTPMPRAELPAAWAVLVRDLPAAAAYAVAPDRVTSEAQALGALPGLGGRVARWLSSLRAAAALAVRARLRVVSDGDVIDVGALLDCPATGPLGVMHGRRSLAGYRVDRSGVYRTVVVDGQLQEERIAWAPVVPLRVYRDQDDASEHVQLGWTGPRSWQSRIYPRSTLRSAQAIVALADQGVEVGSDTARATVSYLRAAEAAWVGPADQGWCSRRLGWQGSTHQVFQLGGTTIQPAELATDVQLVGLDEGQARLSSAVRPRGSIDGWRAAVAPIAEHPSALLAVYASLAAPLLSLLDLRPFGIDWSASPGTGKTTTAELAASVWGDPSLLRQSWGGRIAGIEAAATLMCDLPLILDESTRIRPGARDEVSSLLYAITNGVGRTLGAPGSARGIGMRPPARWRTVLISNGEAPITQWTQDEGVRIRVLSVEGPPIPAGSKALVDACSHALGRHHGHAGPAMLRHLISVPSARPWLARRHAEIEAALVARAPNDDFARQATWLAVLGCAAELLRDHLGCAWATSAPLDLVLGVAAALRVDSATAALREVYAWAATNAARFYGRHDKHHPPASYLGAWKADGDLGEGTIRWAWLGIECRTLEDLLVARGYQPQAVLRDWHARQWLSGDSAAHRRGPAWIGGAEVPCYRLMREAVEETRTP